jgi:uncharacterized protein (TIGR02453 family)
MAFTGVGERALPFFKALAFHQSKEWFEANRAIYEEDVKAPLIALAEDLGAALAKAKVPIRGDKKSLFRIHRDVRFSKDKSPYKTNAGLAMTRSGSKNDPGVLYFHLSPQGCFAAAGFYHPEPLELARMRRAIAREPGAYRRLVAALGKADLALSDEDSAKRVPNEFGAVTEPDLIAGVKRKSFICLRPIKDSQIYKPALVAAMLDFAKHARPLLTWGWSAITDER